MNYLNEELYQYFIDLNKEILQNENLMFPIKVNFYIQKNKNILFPLIQELEEARQKIVSIHGEQVPETGEYKIYPDEMEQTVEELNKLFSLRQDVNFYKIQLNDLENMSLTMPQMNALMFMIEE